ncbi:MAG: bifunctional DNA-formamidopyrimidine glycosylase/DNA-(apurinic or apyrimidinic site) lyase [Candidatus Handelsmanbacteria bacterium]|nr:bifunctional DNA-formamidopyrimidine glycosylase/DNA-(apurinic or apyrimidinic site) lyase [Candidatus Handelsmanbacteria bacterium]
MPELPEVETVRRAMQQHLVGRRVLGVRTSAKPLRQPLPAARLRGLAGDRFTGARRRAKYLLLDLESGRTLLVHLGMTGNLVFRAPGEKHDHVVFVLDREPPLVFSDPRRFGLVLVLDPEGEEDCPYLRGLGPEPLERGFDAAYLEAQCRGRRRPVKALLMDNAVVVGVGNIYASESLFRARIHPLVPAHQLGPDQLKALVREVKSILRESIRRGGTTIGDYLGSGEGGRFQLRLSVYGRAGENCLVCEGPVASAVLGGRSTFYCPNCQKK